MPEFTGDVIAIGTTRLLEAIRRSGIKTRFYQASSSEMFGDAPAPQNEDSAFRPRSPYAAAKVYAYWMVKNYREGYGMFACNGILFNHESPRRGETFVTKKITRALARIKLGLQDKLYLGNLEAKRDWGYAPDFVEAMWLMLQQDEPDVYVVATGESHSIREFAQLAFKVAGLNWKKYVVIDEKFIRPIDIINLRGDYSKAKRKLGWEPETTFEQLVTMMVKADMERVKDPMAESRSRKGKG